MLSTLFVVSQLILASTIVLDPGHGGIDGGTFRQTMLEKHVVLDLAIRVKNHLSPYFTVQLTRESDHDLSLQYPSTIVKRHAKDLQNRLRFLREIKPLYAVSIHLNSSQQTSDRGPIVFFSKNQPQSALMATMLQSALNRVAHTKQKPVMRNSLFLLRHAPCPINLVEVGFITNESDRQRLLQPLYQEQLATAITRGLLDFHRAESSPTHVLY